MPVCTPHQHSPLCVSELSDLSPRGLWGVRGWGILAAEASSRGFRRETAEASDHPAVLLLPCWRPHLSPRESSVSTSVKWMGWNKTQSGGHPVPVGAFQLSQ